MVARLGSSSFLSDLAVSVFRSAGCAVRGAVSRDRVVDLDDRGRGRGVGGGRAFAIARTSSPMPRGWEEVAVLAGGVETAVFPLDCR